MVMQAKQQGASKWQTRRRQWNLRCGRANFDELYAALMFLTRGSLIAFVGGGIGTRTPISNLTGLYKSGTPSCITGLFLYLSKFASRPCRGLLQLILHRFLEGISQSEKSSKWSQKRCA